MCLLCTLQVQQGLHNSMPGICSIHLYQKRPFPRACNGCSKYSSCRFDKFRYYADHAHSAYRDTLVESRAGVNATVSTIRVLGELIKPLLDKGQSVYAILEAHPEIGLSEKTIDTYIETGVFTEAGILINCLDLKK